MRSSVSKVVAVKFVSAFQKELQNISIAHAASGHPQWLEVLSPSILVIAHPLATYFVVAPALDSEWATLLHDVEK